MYFIILLVQYHHTLFCDLSLSAGLCVTASGAGYLCISWIIIFRIAHDVLCLIVLDSYNSNNTFVAEYVHTLPWF